MPPRRMTDDDIQRTVARAIEDADDFMESEIAPTRLKSQRYLDGEVDLESEDGRSKVVATKCRDAFRSVLPVLMRIFMQSGRPVEFTPEHPQSVIPAQQATTYTQSVLERNRAFLLLLALFKDALSKKTGIAKATYDETPEVEIDHYTGLLPDHLMFFEGDPDLEVLEQEDNEDGTINLKVAKTLRRGRIKVEAIPPETFFVDRGAKSVWDYYCMGHSNPDARVGDIVAMGFDFDQVLALAEVGDDDEAEEIARRGWGDDGDEGQTDASMRKVLFTEAYMRMDIEGVGVPRDYKFLCAGDNYTVLRNEDGSLAFEPCDMNPFAAFEVDPEPHAFHGKSLVEIIEDDQDASTSLLRGLLDSVAMANTARTEAVDGQVNMEDLLNNEIGGVVRVKQPGMLREIPMGANLGQVLGVVQYYDATIQQKTGVSDAASMGPDALRNTTATAADGILGAAQAVAELMARVLAEGGMADLCKKIAQLARQHPNPEETILVNGDFVAVDPRSWTAPMGLKVNVGLGTGKHDMRVAMLQATIQDQAMLAQTGSPLVSMTHMRNARADLLAANGLHNADRYYAPMNEQTEAQMAEAAAQQPQQPPPNPLAEAEQIKGQVAIQRDTIKTQKDLLIARAKDDLERDKLEVQIAQDAIRNEQQVRAQMMQPRQFGPQGAPQGQPPQA